MAHEHDGDPHTGVASAETRWTIPATGTARVHSDHRLILLLDGELGLRSSSPIWLKPGSMMVVPAGMPHQGLGAKQAHVWVTRFCAKCLELPDTHPLMSPFHRARRGAMPVVSVDRARLDHVLWIFRALQHEQAHASPQRQELLRCLLLLLLGEFSRGAYTHDGIEPVQGRVADALDFIQRHALTPISLRDVAAAMQLSGPYLATLVKRQTGSTVGDWIRSARVAEACSWLVHSGEPIDEIASRVGWRDTTHFIRQFRRELGKTPAAWRLAHRRGSLR